MNLANRLTIIRIFLVPIFLIFIALKIDYGTFIATFIFILASLTDKLDGYIARSRNQITTFGKFMDPLADKLLVTSALISLVELQVMPGWAAVIIIAREFAISGLRTIAASDGVVIAASWWGKIKTVIQIIAIIALLLKVNINNSQILLEKFTANNVLHGLYVYLPEVLLYIAVVITILSGVDYFNKNKHTINTNK
ncbi:CDP-diacylglycerol--glycerol-3-phosphate 3-phosphatidyltransferase [Clostridium sp. UBA1652]|uniref:CDP-diacylglycerol--glycerol-3-phosphate 3-phosphatidyltransferase n=1 Tax=Clostridium sp. UBA1652 TaxID=1946348 RepID=UPI002580D93F|nr:CDP-diacylglycerol--glycerol-3-phosphate 3-phosphatidyltransferase [Clostridium sp. UBA1652]